MTDEPTGETTMATTELSDRHVLTVTEAATVLRIGRSVAYALTRRWLETEGREGIPCIVLGRSVRVPRAALEQMLDADPSPPARADARRFARTEDATGVPPG